MIAIGCDHGGLDIKNAVIEYLKKNGIEYKDYGCYTSESVDYPKYAYKVATAVANKEAELGILCCGTGIGISIAANKVKGIRAAVVSNEFCAEMTRRHNDANILCMGGRVINEEQAVKFADIFLNTPFEGDRHNRRLDMVSAIEHGTYEDKELLESRINMENQVTVFDHPLIQHKLTHMRDEKTGSKLFRELVSEVSMLMCYEATRDLPLKEVEVQTPLVKTTSKVIAGRKLAFVPILRAGLGMLDAMLEMVPAAKVGHIGLYRDEETHEPVEYYNKLPSDIEERDVFVLDPMLATGGSAVDAINIIKKSHPHSIKFLCIIAAPEGIKALTEAHPDVQVFCAAKDEGLNENCYIMPGLGDAGDRIFGTK